MWENVSRVIVSSYALQGAPYAGQCCKEAEEARMAGIATRWVGPVLSVQAKEEFNILREIQ
jgi:hypothetical protein